MGAAADVAVSICIGTGTAVDVTDGCQLCVLMVLLLYVLVLMDGGVTVGMGVGVSVTVVVNVVADLEVATTYEFAVRTTRDGEQSGWSLPVVNTTQQTGQFSCLCVSVFCCHQHRTAWKD